MYAAVAKNALFLEPKVFDAFRWQTDTLVGATSCWHWQMCTGKGSEKVGTAVAGVGSASALLPTPGAALARVRKGWYCRRRYRLASALLPPPAAALARVRQGWNCRRRCRYGVGTAASACCTGKGQKRSEQPSLVLDGNRPLSPFGFARPNLSQGRHSQRLRV